MSLTKSVVGHDYATKATSGHSSMMFLSPKPVLAKLAHCSHVER